MITFTNVVSPSSSPMVRLTRCGTSSFDIHTSGKRGGTITSGKYGGLDYFNSFHPHHNSASFLLLSSPPGINLSLHVQHFFKHHLYTTKIFIKSSQ
jgi:hypothetical protein